MKQNYATQIGEGESIDSPFIVKVNTSTKQDDSFYRLNGELKDVTGMVPFVLFGAEESVVQLCAHPIVLLVKGKAGKTKFNPMEVRVKELHTMDESDVDTADFEIVAPIPFDKMKKELYQLLNSLHDPDCRNLAGFAFPTWCQVRGRTTPDSVWEMEKGYLNSPAATGNHHCYRHGLLQHSLDVTRSAVALAKASPVPVNIDVVTISALLHDIGKVLEYTTLPNMGGYGRTQKGNLLGHIVLGLMTVSNYIGAVRMLDGFDDNIADHILHCIASHHTKREYGSPVTPMTLEAMCLARADGLDAEAFRVREAQAQYKEGGREAVRLQDNFYYVAPLTRSQKEEGK